MSINNRQMFLINTVEPDDVLGIFRKIESQTVELSPFLSSSEQLACYYDLLNCDLIDITSRQIGANYYDIICDDEGLLKSNHHITLWKQKEPELVGNLLITKYDKMGNNIGLTKTEIIQLKSNLKKIRYSQINSTKIYLAYTHK